jgi:hypothetical protein
MVTIKYITYIITVSGIEFDNLVSQVFVIVNGGDNRRWSKYRSIVIPCYSNRNIYISVYIWRISVVGSYCQL